MKIFSGRIAKCIRIFRCKKCSSSAGGDGDRKMLNRFPPQINKKVLSFSQKQIRNMQMMTVLIAFIYMTLFVYQNVYGIPSTTRSTLQVIAIAMDRSLSATIWRCGDQDLLIKRDDDAGKWEQGINNTITGESKWRVNAKDVQIKVVAGALAVLPLPQPLFCPVYMYNKYTIVGISFHINSHLHLAVHSATSLLSPYPQTLHQCGRHCRFPIDKCELIGLKVALCTCSYIAGALVDVFPKTSWSSAVISHGYSI